ncbi:MAG: regulatory iron-sulfur-containing complex subunit RicT, partial [Bacteroidales bacterium]
LDMKIGDVEYQGDKTKAIFYYIADDRVDFRELIKVMAEEFRIRIEMRQIGARQEAGRIGGIGSCGRELCCSTFLTNFVTVTTTVARNQELSFNPQKLAGQCGKLKCCLNYEVDAYLDAQKGFPSAEIVLETAEGKAYHQKTDIFKRIMWYSFDSATASNLIPVPAERVWEIIRSNRQGIIVDRLLEVDESQATAEIGYMNAAGQESLTRFDQKKNPRRKFKPRPGIRKERGRIDS